MKRVLIVAGDPSGDLIASQLIRSLKKLRPDLEVAGVGGMNIQKVSDRFLKNIVRQHALGFAISPRKILHFRRVLNKIITPELKTQRYDAVIPVDFYGFNCRVAKTAKNLGCKVFYYVSPQFWASRSGRADKLRKAVDLFLCLFPFEIDFYRKKGLPASFVGHPILDSIPEGNGSGDSPPKVESLIGLLPGSRPEEIKRHLPVMIEACERLHEEGIPFRAVLFVVSHVPREFYHALLSRYHKSRFLIDLIQDEQYAWRAQLDLAITASGMETLENTLLGIPMVIMYKTNWVTYYVAKSLIRIPFLGMPNLLAGREVVPEFIQSRATAENVSKPLMEWISSPDKRRTLRSQLLGLRKKFGEGGASDRAAKVIVENVA